MSAPVDSGPRSGGADPRGSGSGGEERPGVRELRARLAEVGYRPSRRLGQNLLLDENLARAIARDAAVGPGDRVLEVGPGAGALTKPLAELGVDLLAVEIDARLLAVARSVVASFPVEFVHADVLAKKSRLEPAVAERLRAGAWHLVSNLPYAVGGPLLCVLARHTPPPASMTVLVQREVADRLVARPGTADWGALSARLQITYDARRVREVPAQVFWPKPKVESTVVRLELRAKAPGPADLAAFDRLVGDLFGRRRQTLQRVLGDVLGSREVARARLSEAGIDPGRRAETLSLAELQALAGR